MDFEAGGEALGSRFVVLKKGLARLERALGQFMLDLKPTNMAIRKSHRRCSSKTM